MHDAKPDERGTGRWGKWRQGRSNGIAKAHATYNLFGLPMQVKQREPLRKNKGVVCGAPCRRITLIGDVNVGQD